MHLVEVSKKTFPFKKCPLESCQKIKLPFHKCFFQDSKNKKIPLKNVSWRAVEK
jgi:hypothetical protein